MYVPSNKVLASQLRAATIILKNKILIELLRDAAERIEDLDKIAEHYRVKAEKAAALQNTAEKMTAKGYRKTSDVAREIFEESKTNPSETVLTHSEFRSLLMHLRGQPKKKYMESEDTE